MNKEIRTICYDEELHIEAYHLEGIVQPFPNHFHEHYVIGFIEDGTGFSDQSHFTNFFSMFIGLAPGVYREIFLDKQNTITPGGKIDET